MQFRSLAHNIEIGAGKLRVIFKKSQNAQIVDIVVAAKTNFEKNPPKKRLIYWILKKHE